MCRIYLNQITNKLLKNINIEIKDGELVVMIGASGAGKSTLLNVIAGFVPCSGEIIMHGRRVNHLPAYRRKVGYVLQDLYLFPHLTVENNILLSMKNLPHPEKEKRQKLEKLLIRFRLENLAKRKPDKLSGGEKQLAAIARAVACEPSILLLDEPFAHLDFTTAGHTRQTFRQLQKELKITTLFVTHDLEEAKALGDRILLMKKGRIVKTFNKTDYRNFLPDIAERIFEAPELRIAS